MSHVDRPIPALQYREATTTDVPAMERSRATDADAGPAGRTTGSPIPEPSMNPPPDDCPFCAIAARPALAVTLFEDPDIIAFLDRGAIRPGHTQIIARQHVPTFETLPPRILNKITALGQQLARRMKQVYHVDRVAFLFTGGDVPHVHAIVASAGIACRAGSRTSKRPEGRPARTHSSAQRQPGGPRLPASRATNT